MRQAHLGLGGELTAQIDSPARRAELWKVLKKQRGGNGMIGGWGERPASERILGTLSSRVWLGRHSALRA